MSRHTCVPDDVTYDETCQTKSRTYATTTDARLMFAHLAPRKNNYSY